jgi:small subunit ribosomal protein S15
MEAAQTFPACSFRKSLLLHPNRIRIVFCKIKLKEKEKMALTKKEKNETIEKFKINENDSGSPEVQIALLSKRIQYLSGHLKTHKKDNHSRRGLIALVSNRRKLLDYLKRQEFGRYMQVIETLGIRK